MTSLKTIAAAALLPAIAATPVFAQAAIQEPGAFAFYYPNLDVLNGGAPTRQRGWPRTLRLCRPMRRGRATSAPAIRKSEDEDRNRHEQAGIYFIFVSAAINSLPSAVLIVSCT
jgi:hypothetical protein